MSLFRQSQNDCLIRFKRSQSKALKDQKGQLVIEYVLLLTLVTILATQVVRLLIGQGETGEQGLIVQKWVSVVNGIAADLIDN